jgi:hypothetical protein
MADENSQRSYRTNEARATTTNSGNDPLAELARLIGQTDPFAEFGRDSARRAPAARSPETSETWPPAKPAALSAPPTAPASAQSEMPPPRMFGTQNYDSSRYASPLAGGAGLYRTANEAPPYADTEQQGGEYAVDDYYQGGEGDPADEDVYDDATPPRRRIGIMAIACVFALAVLGTAGAFGYRALFGASGTKMPPPVINADATPNKIVPSANKDAQSSKQITDRVGTPGQGEKLVPREEQPVDIKDSTVIQPPQQLAQQTAPLAPANGSGVVAAEPKKVRTIVIRPDQVGMADVAGSPQAQAMPTPIQAPSPPVATPAPTPTPPQATKPIATPARPNLPPVVAEANTEPPQAPPVRPAPAPQVHRAASSNAPLSLNPGDEAAAPRSAAPSRAAASAPAAARPAPQPSSGGGFAVQVSAQRSEAEAQSAFRSMQAKFPSQLGNREPMIKRVDLGDKGIYFRAMVGPFASGNEASEVCSSLKSAGGQCIVQKI